MNRHLLVTFVVLVGCGSKQPKVGDPEPEASPDAAPTPVEAPPDAAPLPPPPEVPPMPRSTSAKDLRAKVKASADDHQRLILMGQLAEVEWAATCKKATDGLCYTTPTRAKKAPPTCDHHAADLKVGARDIKKVDAVVKVIKDLQQLWGGGSILHEITFPVSEEQTPAYIQNAYMAEEYGWTLLLLADQGFEDLLRVKAPAGLDFDPDSGMNKASIKKFETWFQALQAAGAEAMQRYQLVIEDVALRQWAPATVIAAVARTATLQARFAAAIYGLEVPKNLVKDEELTAAFCDTLDERAAPLDVAAKASWDACVSMAAELNAPEDRCRH